MWCGTTVSDESAAGVWPQHFQGQTCDFLLLVHSSVLFPLSVHLDLAEKILGNVGSSTRLHGITSQKTAILIFTSVETSDIVCLVTWTKITWRTVVGKLLRRLEATLSGGQVMRKGTECLSLPLPLRTSSSKELKLIIQHCTMLQ